MKKLFFSLFNSELKREIKKRKLERKLKLLRLKPLWIKNRAIAVVLFNDLSKKCRYILKLTLVDSKFDAEKILNNNGFTRIQIDGDIGTLFCRPSKGLDKITVYGNVRGFSQTGDDMTISEFITKVSEHY
jgi:hypothetical protein